MNSSRRIGAGLLLVAGLAAIGGVLTSWIEPLWREQQRVRTALDAPSLDAALGQGVALGVLGGFRTLAADLLWLRAYASWERREAPATEMLLQWTTTVDPRPLYFWLNGARMMAYDLPTWQQRGVGAAPERGAARRAIAFLTRARRHHPASALLWIEQANLELHSLRDLPAAAASYRRAAECADAPYYAARQHGELLRRQGLLGEALAWLVRLHPQLPPHLPAASADLVLARIRQLEDELGVPEASRYRPRH